MPLAVFSRVCAELSKGLIDILQSDLDRDSMLQRICDSVGAQLTYDSLTDSYSVSGDWMVLEHVRVFLTQTLTDLLSRRQQTPNTFINVEKFVIPSFSKDAIKSQETKSKEKEIFSGSCVTRKLEYEVNKSKDVSGCRTPVLFSHTIDNILASCNVSEPSESCDVSSPDNANINSKLSGKKPANILSDQNDDLFAIDTCQDRSEDSNADSNEYEEDIDESDDCLQDIKSNSSNTNVATLKCQDCNFVGKTKNALYFHRYKVHISKPMKCQLCEKTFSNERYLKRHLSSHSVPRYICDICGKKYKGQKTLEDHRKTHHYNALKCEYHCEHCSKVFLSRSGLDFHKKSEHLGQKKRFLCSTCGKEFTTKYTLDQHLNSHTGDRPYHCKLCPKRFSYESALREHKLVHTDTKSFKCKECLKSFNRRSALQMHQNVHKKKKDFICNECGRDFTQKQALQRHERSHNGNKPYSCNLCLRKFSEPSIIRRHLITVHKLQKDVSKWKEDITIDENEREVSKSSSKSLHQKKESDVTGIKSINISESITPSVEKCNISCENEKSLDSSAHENSNRNIGCITSENMELHSNLHMNINRVNGHMEDAVMPLSYQAALHLAYNPSVEQPVNYQIPVDPRVNYSLQYPMAHQGHLNDFQTNEKEASTANVENHFEDHHEDVISRAISQPIHYTEPLSRPHLPNLVVSEATTSIAYTEEGVNNSITKSMDDGQSLCQPYTEEISNNLSAVNMIENDAQRANEQYSDHTKQSEHPYVSEHSKTNQSEHPYVSEHSKTNQSEHPYVSEQSETNQSEHTYSEHSNSRNQAYDVTQADNPQYQMVEQGNSRMEHLMTKRVQQTEPPDNLSISSLYAYYTNLASQYLNISYPSYISPSDEPS